MEVEPAVSEEKLAHARVTFIESCLGRTIWVAWTGLTAHHSFIFLNPPQGERFREYNQLVAQIQRGGFQWFRALAQTVSLIRPTHTSLSKAILAFDWAKGDNDSRRACSELLINLASVHPHFLIPIFTILVRHLNQRVYKIAEKDSDPKCRRMSLEAKEGVPISLR
eukprot:1167195-Amorphochlora_amoeboformis.AAC.1